ncbi:MAG: hypothetical protein ND807_00135 [Vicinamibacterales bacterium]|nr:hypothetical protein [Vicinamibacterales bacterium]
MKTTLFDDAARGPASNEKPALAQVAKRLWAAANDFNARPRPVASWVGGNSNYAEDNATPQVRRLWYPASVGAPALGGVALVVPIADAAAVPLTGLTLNQADADQTVSTLVPQSPGRREDVNDNANLWYPKYATSTPLMAKQVSDYSLPVTAREIKIQAGELGVTSGPQVRAGVIYERQIETKNDSAGVAHPVVGVEAMPLDHVSQGSEIIGAGLNGRSLADLRTFINRLTLEKGIQFSFNFCKIPSVALGVSIGNNYCYFHNGAYGAVGTPPSVTGPGIDVPLRYTSRGRLQTVRVYVRVLAAMSGTTDTGSLAVYNRDNSGGMTGPTTLTHPETITGTTFAWYPSGNFNAATDPYFLGNANPAYLTDHILPCGRSNGSTNQIIIAAYTMFVCASNA